MLKAPFPLRLALTVTSCVAARLMVQGVSRSDFQQERADAEGADEAALLPAHKRSGICFAGYAAPNKQDLHDGEMMFANDRRLRLDHACVPSNHSPVICRCLHAEQLQRGSLLTRNRTPEIMVVS